GLLMSAFRVDESRAMAPTLPAFARAYRGPLLVLALVGALWGIKTVTRNADWFDNVTLLVRDVRLAPGSARLHAFLGREYLQRAERAPGRPDDAARRDDIASAVAQLTAALELRPRYGQALGDLARAHQALGQSEKARSYYERALEVEPTDGVLHNDFGNFLLRR